MRLRLSPSVSASSASARSMPAWRRPSRSVPSPRIVARLQKRGFQLDSRWVGYLLRAHEELLTAVELLLHPRVERKIPSHLDDVNADHLGLSGLCDPGHEPNDVGVRAAPRERHEDAL